MITQLKYYRLAQKINQLHLEIQDLSSFITAKQNQMFAILQHSNIQQLKMKKLLPIKHGYIKLLLKTAQEIFPI